MRSLQAVVVTSFLSFSCMSNMDHGGHGALPALAPMIHPAATSNLLKAAVAVDENPDPTIVELHLTAAPTQLAYLNGQPTAVWAYNGSVPGPVIEAKIGDLVIVHFKNDLPEPTTIHWHGVRVPNEMDGAGRLSQPIPPGDSFDYKFVVPDAGLFWYHPHVRSDVQVEKGLYGSILVKDPTEPPMGVAAEHTLMLDDVRVNPSSGQVIESTDARTDMMGREGNLLLVNGQASNAAIEFSPGERLRLHLVNAANARFFSLHFDGGVVTQVGTDGGLLPSPRLSDKFTLVPGERADVMLEATGTVAMKVVPYERAKGAGGGEEVSLLRFVPRDIAPILAAPLPSVLRAIEIIVPSGEGRKLVFNERMAHHGMEFTINGQVFPNVPPLIATLGSRQLWTVQNESDMDHPFHLHGFFFQKRGIAEWKDTINVPAGKSAALVVDFATRPGAAGDWMYHCHILKHAEAGMMGEAQIR